MEHSCEHDHQAHQDHEAGCPCGHHSHHEGAREKDACRAQELEEDTGPDGHRRPSLTTCSCCGDGAEDDGCGCDHGGEQDSDETRNFLLRLGVALALTVIAAFVSMPFWASLPLYLAAYGIAGWEVLASAVRNTLKGRLFDENFLMSLATVGAFAIGDYAEAVSVMLFYGVGELLQGMAVRRSRRSIAALMDIRPDAANRIIDSGVERVDPAQVSVGDRVLVRPGEKLPLDGIVRKGSSSLNTAALTGESLPRSAEPGDEVLSGSINLSGVLEIEVTKPFGESTVSKILDLVQNAGAKKAESEKFITRFARWYTPAVVGGAVLAAFVPPLFLGFDTFPVWLYRALSFLIISCPCALVVSIPVGIMGGIGGASRYGVLVKGGNYLEALAQTRRVVFDKTGTLTKGSFEVAELLPAPGMEAGRLLRLAALTEQSSGHPIARCITAAYDGGETVTGQKEKPGFGTSAVLEGKTVLAGSARWLEENGVAFTPVTRPGSVVYVAYDGAFAGTVVVSDREKETARQGVEALRSLGVSRIVMLTGDQPAAAEEIARKTGVDAYRAGLLPGDKVDELEKLMTGQSAAKGKTVFVGDGINDAPVLARADIGVAMGGIGSDAAIEAADVVLMTDDPLRLATAIRIARKTRRIVTQNIVFALGIKAAILVLSMIGFASLWFAIFADVGVALLAVLNALRAMKIKE